MNDLTGGIIGISLGVVLITGVQAACYKYIAWENYHKAVVIVLSSVIITIATVLFILKITT